LAPQTSGFRGGFAFFASPPRAADRRAKSPEAFVSPDRADPAAPKVRTPPAARRAAPRDVRGLAELVAARLPDLAASWDADALALELERPGSAAWVVREAGEVVGGAVARGAADEVELLWIAVESGRQRRGVGRRLLSALLGWADESAACVLLEVRASNGPARALYERLGFVVLGRRPRYYRDGEDAVLFRHGPPAEVTP
jgi:ribosomal-protein-alanine N-acetyltransferase